MVRLYGIFPDEGHLHLGNDGKVGPCEVVDRDTRADLIVALVDEPKLLAVRAYHGVVGNAGSGKGPHRPVGGVHHH